MTVVRRGIGNVGSTRLSGGSRTYSAASRSGSAATQSVSAAAIAAVMKYGTVSITRRRTRARSHARWATRWIGRALEREYVALDGVTAKAA